ncbi:MAG: hypothetical protein GY757_55730, partial [bacterium]|nr:hypothetical protein [bacterium]
MIISNHHTLYDGCSTGIILEEFFRIYDIFAAGKEREETKKKDRNKKFDLRQVPFRITLCKCDSSKYTMIISNHHILYDGWSTGIILEEFFRIYDIFAAGKEPEKTLKTGFKVFLKWIRDREGRGQEVFWKKYLEGFDTRTQLSVKRRSLTAEGEGAYSICFDREESTATERFAARHKVTQAALLYSAWGILQQRYTNSDDVLFGVTVSGRPPAIPGIEKIVGLFINTQPLRVRTGCQSAGISAEASLSRTCRNLIGEVDGALREREEYETTPLVK